MSVMIERVALAIDECPEWPAKTYRERCARAAIKAMREPTHEMVRAGEEDGGHSIYRWEAMVDTALAPIPSKDINARVGQ